jgi:leader peptidase (prepilin peptidase)/N-methyltransferase
VPGTVIGLVLSMFLPPGWMSSLIGVAVGGGILFGIAETYYRVRGVDGLGMGDVKMLAMIGAFLGWQLALVTLILASFTGALLGVVLIVTRRGGMQAALPFGTFLAVAAAVAAVAGDSLITWYLSYYQ